MKFSFPFTPRALIFDLDGTLIDSMPTHFAAWSKVCARYGISFSEKRFYELAGTPSDKVAKRLIDEQHLSCDPQEVSQMKERIFLEGDLPLTVFPETLEVVEEYFGKIPLAVATGGYREVASLQLERTGLTRYFAAVACGDEVALPKPAPDVFLEAARRIHVEPSECIAFEDAELGLEAIRHAGMYPIDVRPIFGSPIFGNSK